MGVDGFLRATSWGIEVDFVLQGHPRLSNFKNL